VRQPDKTTLLLVFEALVERRSRIGDLLQRRAPLRQILGDAREAVECPVCGKTMTPGWRI
jgi:hypothetical protein